MNVLVPLVFGLFEVLLLIALFLAGLLPALG